MHDPIFSRLFHFPKGGNTRQGKKERKKEKKRKALGLFQLHKLLPEASKCCKKHTQTFRFEFNQTPGHLDLFKCQQPPSSVISGSLTSANVFLFHRNSKSNLGAPVPKRIKGKCSLPAPSTSSLNSSPPAAFQ